MSKPPDMVVGRRTDANLTVLFHVLSDFMQAERLVLTNALLKENQFSVNTLQDSHVKVQPVPCFFFFINCPEKKKQEKG